MLGQRERIECVMVAADARAGIRDDSVLLMVKAIDPCTDPAQSRVIYTANLLEARTYMALPSSTYDVTATTKGIAVDVNWVRGRLTTREDGLCVFVDDFFKEMVWGTRSNYAI